MAVKERHGIFAGRTTMYLGRQLAVALLVMAMGHALPMNAREMSNFASTYQGYAGSKSCMECHERFYGLWSTSRHGLAMQPYTPELAKANLTPQSGKIKIGKQTYHADIKGGWVVEKGPKREKKYKIEYVLGGKNVYYLLTGFPRGRLQTLPIAYDVNGKFWFDTAASGIRHTPGSARDQQVIWKDGGYTFNTSCHNCHVSQLTSNYDLKTDTYKTTWAEPGINCETCHGASAEHNRVMKETPRGQQPKDYKIISVKKFTPEQHNGSCGGCHAKMMPITATVTPGGRFFDHYDIVALEDPDFYPDGRDLGENYTYTSWLMSPCAKNGKINCVTCHTSSGRYRFKAEEKAQNACMPCHEKYVKNAPAHTHHKEGTEGNKCISCHMPMTSFAQMKRTDHSMLPPTPAVTIVYKSPNACNLCHTDKDAAWADGYVRQWRTRDYQAPVLKRAALIDSARKREWKRLPEMLEYVSGKDRDEVFAASFLRMMPAASDPKVVPVLLKAMNDPSPLVRSSAADALQHVPGLQAVQALVKATGDDCRLVRVRAAASLARYPNLNLSDAEKKSVSAANTEYLASLTSRPDQWSSYYDLGNYYTRRGDLRTAISFYDTALKLEPRAVPAMVNQSMAYTRLGDGKNSETTLQKALKTAPDSAVTNFNMGLLKAGQNDMNGARKYLEAALKYDPKMAEAAYNLCIVLAKGRMNEAIAYCSRAAKLRPQEPKYVYTLGFFQQKKGNTSDAVNTLAALITEQPDYFDAYLLLGEIYEKEGRKSDAEDIYNRALALERAPTDLKKHIKRKIELLKNP